MSSRSPLVSRLFTPVEENLYPGQVNCGQSQPADAHHSPGCGVCLKQPVLPEESPAGYQVGYHDLTATFSCAFTNPDE